MFERTSALFAHNSERQRSGRMGRSDCEIACSVRNWFEGNIEVRNQGNFWTRTKARLAAAATGPNEAKGGFDKVRVGNVRSNVSFVRAQLGA